MYANSTLRKNPSRRPTRGIFLLAGLLVLLCAPAARANTYLFSFTAEQALDALIASKGWGLVSESAYFAFFMQPQIGSFSYISASSPNPNDANAWMTNTITDPANPLGAGSWAQFSKTPTQNFVTVASYADTPGTNIFLGHTFSDAVAPPYGWGSTPGNINTVMDLNARFSFVVSTPGPLSGSYTVTGKASALVSGSPLAYTNVKENGQQAFSLTLTPTVAVPEPHTWIYFFIGVSALVIARRKIATRTPKPDLK